MAPTQLALPFYGQTIDVNGLKDPKCDQITYWGKAVCVFDNVYRLLRQRLGHHGRGRDHGVEETMSREMLNLVLIVLCLVVVEIIIVAVIGSGSTNSTTPTGRGAP